jgi:ATP-binding cassette subfamily B protein
MYFISPVFSATLLVWVICFFGISIICSKKVKANAHDYASSQAIVSGKVIDSIANVSNVRLFARERFELQYLGKYLSSLAAKFRHKEWFLLKLWWFQGMSITGLMVVMLYSLARLRMQGLVTVGDFAFIMGLAIFVTENVWWLTEQLDTINNSIGQCQQSLRTIVHPHEITDKPHATELQVITGAISFEQVCFYYIKDNNLFDHLSIVISGGQKVGLVGFSGSGKTSFVNLIVRLFDITGGSIKIDGQDIAGVTQNSLRDNISFIPQDPVLFHRSLIENIRYGKGDASREEVVEAAKKAHAHQFILEIPGGYDALVGERGIKLSGGQRQRIAIARAMIKDSPIVILDEATSALDSVTEGYIQDSLDSLLMHNKTVLVIAHRLSTLLDMDRILVFDKGVIVEDGNHNELLKKNGMYSLLWNSQVGGFLPE